MGRPLDRGSNRAPPAYNVSTRARFDLAERRGRNHSAKTPVLRVHSLKQNSCVEGVEGEGVVDT
jgi:hypothetical protein